ncbi:MAG: hypothetical protein KJP12_07750 [Acidimicrobiia bacterium]|nr:hypothetical protein [Acidimicrobiia bacterium]MBT8215104.1 hypothetical protein [Acidimicrobiia bacterium]NNK91811.1 hypothetical protein [Acidimicrobiia bacterium]
MHTSRILAVAGSIIGIVGLFFTSIETDAEALLPTLNQANPAFPDGLPTVWGGLDTWAQVVLVILIAVVLYLALRPVISRVMDRTSGITVAVIGVLLGLYAIVKWTDASDSADSLQGSLGQAAQAGLIPQAFEVSPSAGFIILLAGTVIVAVGGLLAAVQSSNG